MYEWELCAGIWEEGTGQCGHQSNFHILSSAELRVRHQMDRHFCWVGLFVSVSTVAADTGTRVLYFIDAQEAASLAK